MPAENPKRPASADRRVAILAETARLVSERGYYGFGIAELGQRCGLSKPGLLHHFPSKDALLIELLRDRDMSNAFAVGRLLDMEGGASIDLRKRDDVLKIFAAMVKHNSHQPELVRLYAVLKLEALYEGHPAHAFFAERERTALGRFAMLLVHHDPEPPRLARRFMALMTGMETQWLQEAFAFDIVAEWEPAASALLPS